MKEYVFRLTSYERNDRFERYNKPIKVVEASYIEHLNKIPKEHLEIVLKQTAKQLIENFIKE